MEKKKKTPEFWRYIAFLIVLFGIFVWLTSGLVNLQLKQSDVFLEKVDETRTKTIALRGKRGNISTSDSVIMAEDELIYNVTFQKDATDNTKALYKQYTASILETIDIIEKNGGEIAVSFVIDRDPETNEWRFNFGSGVSDTVLETRERQWRSNNYLTNLSRYGTADQCIERLKERYHVAWFAETAETVQIRFSIMKDQVSMCLDTCGEGLHKRGYRPAHNAAPLRETLAAAMVTLSRYRGRDDFADPFCGSGTIPIEAALIARDLAPGRDRHFAAMDWRSLDPGIWTQEREAARAREYHGDYRIFASDIDPKAVAIARANAQRAGVGDIVQFEVADARGFDRKTQRGVIVTNPPYGERIGEKQEAEALYRDFGAALRGAENWQLFLLSSHTEFERCFGRNADKKRKLYNGMIKCDLFMYLK